MLPDSRHFVQGVLLCSRIGTTKRTKSNGHIRQQKRPQRQGASKLACHQQCKQVIWSSCVFRISDELVGREEGMEKKSQEAVAEQG